MMKKVVVCLTLAAFANMAVAGIPVISPAELAQQIQQVEQLKRQLAELKNVQKTTQDQLKAMTGNYGYGQIGTGGDLQLRPGEMPKSWQDVVAMRGKGPFSDKLKYYQALLKLINPKLYSKPDSQSAKNEMMSAEAVQATLALSDALFDVAEQRRQNMADLIAQVDKTPNAKAAQDLSNRISAENGLIQLLNGQASLLTARMSGIAENSKAQAAARRRQAFKWDPNYKYGG